MRRASKVSTPRAAGVLLTDRRQIDARAFDPVGCQRLEYFIGRRRNDRRSPSRHVAECLQRIDEVLHCGVFVLFVHFLADCTKRRFQIKELKIPQVAKSM
ncbi:hypothetical protein QFZ99_005724 [Paraburkholderia atlantica]|uniref:hypothetical protein n=1 Tax=Paraburkholderia atlantica TaxID=2654982 RepID=UPI003D1E4797